MKLLHQLSFSINKNKNIYYIKSKYTSLKQNTTHTQLLFNLHL